ncbi:MAG: hypothetical protein MUE71_05025 [Chitinophagaceae bacterium]|jgi:hypothetical protein|nr:hypothetical protein [Chitinophagaceae bacterium]
MDLFSVAQDSLTKKEIRKAIMKDTLDGKLDLSRFLIDMKGFVPVPLIITEPALGGFGGLMAFTFLSPKKVDPKYGYVPPDITAIAGMYTANNSWLLGGGRIGSLPKAGVKYRAFAGYGSINLDFYREIAEGTDQKFSFNIKALPIYLSVSKKVSKSDIYLGTEYIYSSTTLKPEFDENLPDLFPDKELDSKIGSLGFFADWDKRNNFFTPDKGFRINTVYAIDDDWTGSDYNYQKLTGFVNWFLPVKNNWISGLRIDAQHVFDRPPFYLLPFINLRGVPLARYQGFTTVLAETEQRYDFSRRWSGVAFAGMGKAMMENQSFGDADLIYNYGAGFRYLVARAFGIRAGIDVAGGPDSFGWYIVFGHNWNR